MHNQLISILFESRFLHRAQCFVIFFTIFGGGGKTEQFIDARGKVAFAFKEIAFD